MKTIFSLSIAALSFAFLVSCGGGDSTASSDALPEDIAAARGLLKAKRQELRSLKESVTVLEAHIAKLDPSAVAVKEILVTTKAVTVKKFSHFVEVQGSLLPAQDPAMASSETGGRIAELLVKENAYVKKGDLIAKINLESIQKSIDELEKTMELAQDMFKRQENLWKQNIGSEIQYLQAKNQVESLTKTKERLEFELTKSNVYAPAAGYVEKIMIKEGEMSGPGVPILQIVNTSQLKLVAGVPEIYLGKVRKGETVRVNFPALNKDQEVRVTTIGRMINPTNRTFEVEAQVGSEKGLLKPNLLASVFVEDYSKKDAVVVPDQFIMQDVSGNNYIMVAKGNKAVKRVVELGKDYNNETVIETGFDGTELLIVKGARKVADGDLIKVVEQ